MYILLTNGIEPLSVEYQTTDLPLIYISFLFSLENKYGSGR